MAKKREMWELQQMQALPLHLKIRLTQQRIREWVNEFGLEGVYVSFYGKDWMDERDLPVLKMAIDALKKQIPMKPTGEHYAHMRCPSCNHRIPSGGGSSSRRRDNWCNYCGQKIDWGGD